MTFTKYQKIATIVFIVFLIAIFLFLTPFSYWDGSHRIENFYYGNFFTTNDAIVYTKLFIEIGALTVIYFLSLIILKSKK